MRGQSSQKLYIGNTGDSINREGVTSGSNNIVTLNGTSLLPPQSLKNHIPPEGTSRIGYSSKIPISYTQPSNNTMAIPSNVIGMSALESLNTQRQTISQSNSVIKQTEKKFENSICDMMGYQQSKQLQTIHQSPAILPSAGISTRRDFKVQAVSMMAVGSTNRQTSTQRTGGNGTHSKQVNKQQLFLTGPQNNNITNKSYQAQYEDFTTSNILPHSQHLTAISGGDTSGLQGSLQGAPLQTPGRDIVFRPQAVSALSGGVINNNEMRNNSSIMVTGQSVLGIATNHSNDIAFGQILNVNGGGFGGVGSARNNQINNQTTNNGFSDPSDRSTTAGTAFPQLSNSKNSFHRQRPTAQPAVSNFWNQGGNETQGSGVLTGVIGTQITPSTNNNLLQGNSNNQSNKKLRQIPRRQYKIFNSEAIEDFNHQNNKFTTVAGNTLQTIEGYGITPQSHTSIGMSGTQLISNMAQLRNSPIDNNKLEQKANIASGQVQSSTHLKIPIPSQFGFDDKNSASPGMATLQQKKQRKESFTNATPTANQMTIEPSPVPMGSKSSHLGFQSVSGQFYPLPTQQSITSQTINYDTQAETLNAGVTTSINQVRDIKIRKLNPNSHSKNTIKRFTPINGSNSNLNYYTQKNNLNNANSPFYQGASSAIKSHNKNAPPSQNQILGTAVHNIRQNYCTGYHHDLHQQQQQLNNNMEQVQTQQDGSLTNHKGGGWSNHLATNLKVTQTLPGDQKLSRTNRNSEDYQPPSVVIKMKPGFNSDERKRKFISHSKFQSLAKQNLDSETGGIQISQEEGQQYNNQPYNAMMHQTFGIQQNLEEAVQNQPQSNEHQMLALTPQNTKTVSKETNYLKDDGNVVFDSYNREAQSPRVVTTIINVLEIENELRSPSPRAQLQINEGYYMSSDINFGSVQQKNSSSGAQIVETSTQDIVNYGRIQPFNQNPIEISGFDFKDQSSEKNLRFKMPPQVQQPKALEIIVEENKERSVNTTLIEQSQEPTSNASNVIIQQNDSGSQILQNFGKQESNTESNALNTSIESNSPIFAKMLSWRKQSEAFSKVYKEIQDRKVLQKLQENEEFELKVQQLSKISQNEQGCNIPAMTVEEIKRCLFTIRKTQLIKERFQNPYLKKMRRKSLGTSSRNVNEDIILESGDDSSYSLIEENIVIGGTHSGETMTKSMSQALINYRAAQQLAQQKAKMNQAPPVNNNDKNGWKTVRQSFPVTTHTKIGNHQNNSIIKTPNRGNGLIMEGNSQKKKSPLKHERFSAQAGENSPLQNKSINQVAIDESAGGKSAPVPERTTVRQSFDSKSQSGSGGGLTTVEIKRLQYSQKNQSNKVMFALGPRNNETHSNSFIGGNYNNKVKSQQHKSNDSNSHKSDPLIQNQNRLNKFSSGSHTDSYYIPNSGESFHYQGFPSRMNPLQRQSKSMIRHAQGGYNNNLNNQIDSSGSGGKQNNPFNDVVLNGQKAILSERINAALYEKVQGNLIKWRQLRKLGQGTSGEVFLAQDIQKSNAVSPFLFVVKKLNVFSYNSGIDQNAVLKLKNEIEVYRKLNHENIVKYIGSEIVSNQFCIYLEYLAGGNIQQNYQNHLNKKLSEVTIKLYIKQILTGLIYLHSNKVIHCDLKGANVMVDESKKVVKLTDFGCSRLFESSISTADMNGAIRGSLAWMAPEVLANKGIRRKADIWSLGCLVIEMAVGGNPWGSELFAGNNFQAMLKIVDPNSFPPMPQDMSAEGQDFIKRCLTRDYDLRPSAKDLIVHPWLLLEKNSSNEEQPLMTTLS